MQEKEILEMVAAKLKNRPDVINVNEFYLADVIEDAINDVEAFINHRVGEELDSGLITPIKDLCIVRINLTGTEGISSSSKAGTSETYLDDIPKSIKAKLRKYRRLP